MKRALICLALAACSGKSAPQGGLQVTVELKAPLSSHCVQVAVKRGDGSELRTLPIAIDGKTKIVAGIAQGTLPSSVKVYAEGFSDAKCATVTHPAERSIDADATFEPQQVKPVALTLEGAAGREVDCADGFDDDQDGTVDCLDADCDHRPCLNGGDCSGGVCRGAASEANLCADGEDNDGDGTTDCDDPDCLGAACRSTDKCIAGATCSATKACTGGAPKPCTMPLACALAPGACDPVSGQCHYGFADAGSPCEDGNLCTMADQCNGAGTCSPGAMSGCTMPPEPCFTATGATCDPITGCHYPLTSGAACDDGQSCTANDACGADGGCAGVRTACVPSGCQAFAGQCEADAGCVFSVADAGAACDAGVCNPTGACIPLFPYPPSNFTEAQVPTPADEVLLNCGTTIIDTGVTGPPTFSGWCMNQPFPGAATLAQPGGGEAVLLSFSKLTVAAGATLRLRGARPVIIAATRDVVVAGIVEVAAGPSACADGGAGVVGQSGTTNGGGGGGSFMTAGGSGGTGSQTLGTNGNGGRAGVVDALGAALVPLRGGCPGALGASSGSARPASGGGALQISSATAVLVSGTITAPGQGGPGANNGTGGNGAGSGGAILLEALQLTVSAPAAITANGGGGSEGGGPALDGAPGERGTADGGPAAGGDSIATGGAGGRGAAQGFTAGDGADGVLGTGNGGGGGGGLGRIRVRASVSCSVGVGVVFSPALDADAGC